MIAGQRFDIGTQFLTRGKHARLCTVTDMLRTYNSAGDLVRLRYVATHEFMGQTMTDSDVCDATIAMGRRDPRLRRLIRRRPMFLVRLGYERSA